MRMRAAVSLTAVLTLLSCSLPDAPRTELLPQEDGGQPRKVSDSVVVERAVRRLVEADSGYFASALLIGGGETDYVDSRGSWRFSTQEAQLRLASTPDRGRPATYDYRFFREGFFVRTTTGRERSCWTAVGTPEPAPSTPAGQVRVPSQVQALLTARGARGRSPEGAANGTVGLAESVGVLGPAWSEAVRRAGADDGRADDVRVPVTFTIRQGRFTGWKVEGTALAPALREAGVRLNRAMRAQVLSFSAQVELRKLGAPVDVELPADDLC